MKQSQSDSLIWMTKGSRSAHLVTWIIFMSALIYLKFTAHELWKDEWQAWFVAKDMGLTDMFSFLYYEGHPALWYVYLKIFTLFSGAIDAVTLLHIAHTLTIAIGSYCMFVLFRMPIIYKVLFSLSYFIFFEYGMIDRGYFMVISLYFLAIYLLSQKEYLSTQLGVVLFLLCQTEVYGVFMAICLGLYIWVKNDYSFNIIKRKEILGLLLGIIVFVISVFPRTAGHVAKTQGKDLGVVDTFLTAFQGNLSNTFMIGSTLDTFTYGWTYIGLFISILCMVGLWYIFKSNQPVLLVSMTYIGIMLVFSLLFFLGGIRQWGMGFIFFVGMIELVSAHIEKSKIASIIPIVFSLFGMVHNIKAVRQDIQIPFTNAKKAGEFIQEKVPAKVPIVAMNKFETTPVIGYAGRSFYELPTGNEFTYFRWVDKIYLPTENELKLFGKFKGVGGIVVIAPKPLDTGRFPNAKLWQTFADQSYKNENYYLYTLTVK